MINNDTAEGTTIKQSKVEFRDYQFSFDQIHLHISSLFRKKIRKKIRKEIRKKMSKT